MLFYFLITIVFISELIIALTIVLHLLKLDKKIVEYNNFLNEIKPLVKDIMETTRKLSEEFLKLVPKIVEKAKIFAYSFLKDQLKSVIGALTFWLVKKEVEKRA